MPARWSPVRPLPSLPVLGEAERFPVRRILCVAKNYADHVREMGSDPEREPPTFFDKPLASLVPPGDAVSYPRGTSNLHHEVELVLAIGHGHQGVLKSEAAAAKLIVGAAVGVDLTRRDRQNEAKKAGRPWHIAKGFDCAAPVGFITLLDAPMDRGAVRLDVNGETRQSGDLSQMIWTASEIVVQASRHVDLAAGDLIFTGTPAGVGALLPGDRVTASIEGLESLVFDLKDGTGEHYENSEQNGVC